MRRDVQKNDLGRCDFLAHWIHGSGRLKDIGKAPNTWSVNTVGSESSPKLLSPSSEKQRTGRRRLLARLKFRFLHASTMSNQSHMACFRVHRRSRRNSLLCLLCRPSPLRALHAQSPRIYNIHGRSLLPLSLFHLPISFTRQKYRQEPDPPASDHHA